MIPERTVDTHEVMYDRVPHTRSYRFWAVPGRTTQANTQLDLAASVLGSGKNSRLYQALVYNNQLANTVSVYVEEHELTSFFTIDTRLKDGSSLEEVNRIIDAELERFLAEGPTEAELERVKTQTNAALIRGLEQIGGFSGKATALARGELYAGDPGFFRVTHG